LFIGCEGIENIFKNPLTDITSVVHTTLPSVNELDGAMAKPLGSNPKRHATKAQMESLALKRDSGALFLGAKP
jgi:hypothetical protein